MSEASSDSWRQLRADIARFLDTYKITTRSMKCHGYGKNLVSALRKQGDDPVRADILTGVLQHAQRERNLPPGEVSDLLARCDQLSRSGELPDVGDRVELSAEATSVDSTGPSPRPRRRLLQWTGGVLGLGLAGLLIALLILTDGGDSRPPRPTTPQIVTVRNQLALGPQGLSLDPAGPAYLSSRPVPYCRKNGCMVPNSELAEGQTLHVDCEIDGTTMLNYNASDPAPGAADNPNRKTLRLWYHATTDSGVSGFISAIYLDSADQGGHGLPACR